MRETERVLATMKEKRGVAMLIDPDKYDSGLVSRLVGSGLLPTVFLVGGSIVQGDTREVVRDIKRQSTTPVVLFPGDNQQLAEEADGLLLLSLISGRNAEYLISQHVRAAHRIAKMDIEVISTGYMLIDGGKRTSVEYISGTTPIPADKVDIAAATALAGRLLGMKAIYLEAGSGAKQAVSSEMIKAVRESIGDMLLIVGGGLRTVEEVSRVMEAGADIAVIGTVAEQNSEAAAEILRYNKTGR